MFNVPKDGGLTAQTLPPHPPLPDEQLSIQLHEHLHQLQLILPVISTAVMALHHQNAELDHDIARVLDFHASAPLDSEIENLETLLATIACRPRRKEVAA